jgi:predicted NBD/HSP70 family sugar kinase
MQLVMRAIIESQYPVSRADVATATGLARATVSSLVDSLVSANLLMELPPVTTGSAGRPAIPLQLAPRSIVGIGLEINPDFLGYAVIDLSGDVIDEGIERGSFINSDPVATMRQAGVLIRDVIAELQDQAIRVAGLRLAMPGLVNSKTGFLEVAPNLGWKHVDVAELLGITDVPVLAENEAKLAAFAELKESGRKDFLWASPEVGIGGAIVSDGRVYSGQNGWNSEIGHIVVDPSGPPCSCGARGCLEQYAGRVAITKAAGLPEGTSLVDLIEVLKAGDPVALAAMDAAGRAFGAALADWVNLMGIFTLVIGGPCRDLLGWGVDAMRTSVHERVLAAPFTDITIVKSVTEENSAMKGAALAVLDEVLAQPAAWI